MNRHLAAIIPALCLWTSAFAQSPATQPAPTTLPISGRFGETIKVFNGKDLAGWTWYTQQQGSRVEDAWVVRDGVLRGTGQSQAICAAEKEFGPDYVLIIEYRQVMPGGGGFLFGISGPDRMWPKMMQLRLAPGSVGDLWNQGAFNWFIDNARYVPQDRLRKIGPASEKPPGEWNTLEIFTDHGNLTVHVNGQLQNNADGMDDVTGRVGLQSEGAEMEYRKIELTPILKRS